nr:TMV resistance protein N-like [Ipomoea batatas]
MFRKSSVMGEFKYIFVARICAPIGRVIELDSATIRKSQPSVAKVRLEIDVTKPRLERIWIEDVNREGVVPIYCEECSRFGHGRLTCRRVRIGVDRRGDDLGGANPVSGTMEEMNALGENVGEAGDEGTGVETVEGENETLNNKGMPTVCGNAPVTETETEIVEEAVSKVKEGEKVVSVEGDKGEDRAEKLGSKQCVKCDVYGEAMKGGEDANIHVI